MTVPLGSVSSVPPGDAPLSSGPTGLRLANTSSLQTLAQWRKLGHTSLVALREFFTTKAFGDNCECGVRGLAVEWGRGAGVPPEEVAPVVER